MLRLYGGALIFMEIAAEWPCRFAFFGAASQFSALISGSCLKADFRLLYIVSNIKTRNQQLTFKRQLK